MRRIKKQVFPWLIAFIVSLLIPAAIPSTYWINVFCLALINVIVVLGLNFITGLTGNMNLGTAGIMGLGSYVSALLCTKLGVSPWIGLLASIAVGYLVGQGLGYPSLRVKGVYLSLTTIAFAEIVRLVLNNSTAITNGSQGVLGIPPYSIFGFVISGVFRNYYFLLLLVIFFVWISYRIVHSKWGRAFKALSDNPDAAESLGINIARVKIMAFTLCTIFGCFAGALYAHYNGYINPSTYVFNFSVKYVIMLLVGGVGLVSGNIFGAIVITLIPEV